MPKVRGEGSIYQRKSDGLWVASIDLGRDGTGKRRRKTITSKNKADVITKRRKLLRDIEDGVEVRSSRTTVQAWLNRWHADICKPRVSPRVWRDYRSHLDNHIIPIVGAHQLDKLTPANIREMHTYIAGKNLGRTVEVCHNILSRALKDAVREGLIRENVCERVDKPKATSTARGAMTADQAKAVLATAIEADDPMVSRFAAALLLGSRKGELLGLTWDRIDFTNHTIDLSWQLQRIPWRHGCGKAKCAASMPSRCERREPDVPPGYEHRECYKGWYWVRPKTTASIRVVPMPALLETLLIRHRDTTAYHGRFGLVWSNDDGRPLKDSEDRDAWYAALERAGCPRMHLHCARHTTATLLLEAGVSPEVIAQILGHSSILSTKGYMHVDRRMAAAALGALGTSITPELGPAPAQ